MARRSALVLFSLSLTLSLSRARPLVYVFRRLTRVGRASRVMLARALGPVVITRLDASTRTARIGPVGEALFGRRAFPSLLRSVPRPSPHSLTSIVFVSTVGRRVCFSNNNNITLCVYTLYCLYEKIIYKQPVFRFFILIHTSRANVSVRPTRTRSCARYNNILFSCLYYYVPSYALIIIVYIVVVILL